MPVSTSTTVANWILSEVMSQIALDPLRGKYVLLPFLNMADISGRATKVRKIRKKSAIAAAVDDTEGLAFSNPPSLGVAANVSITPTTKVQGVQLSTDAVELALPGVPRSQVISAIEAGNAAALPLVRDAMTEILQAHYMRAETDSLALFSGLSESSGTTNTTLSFATLIDSMLKLFDNNVESEDAIFVIDEVGLSHLRTLAAGGTGASLSAIFGGGGSGDVSFFNHRPDASRNGLRGSFAGIPLIAANRSIMATANAGVDRVGAIIVAGRGETGAPGSVRGFAEMVERYEPSLGFSYDLSDDTLLAVGRWCWGLGEHTDEHGVRLIYRAT